MEEVWGNWRGGEEDEEEEEGKVREALGEAGKARGDTEGYVGITRECSAGPSPSNKKTGEARTRGGGGGWLAAGGRLREEVLFRPGNWWSG